MRRQPQKHLTFGQGLAHQPEGVVLEIAEPAMNQLGGGRRRAGGKVVLLDQKHAQATARSIPRNASAVDATPNDSEVVVCHAF